MTVVLTIHQSRIHLIKLSIDSINSDLESSDIDASYFLPQNIYLQFGVSSANAQSMMGNETGSNMTSMSNATTGGNMTGLENMTNSSSPMMSNST